MLVVALIRQTSCGCMTFPLAADAINELVKSYACQLQCVLLLSVIAALPTNPQVLLQHGQLVLLGVHAHVQPLPRQP
jgi:hypothetical protein